MSFRLRFGAVSSLWFLFTNKVMVRTFLAGYMIHFWPTSSMDLSEITPLITNVRESAAKLIESIQLVVAQLEATKEWSKVDRDQLKEFNTTTSHFLTAFHQWKQIDGVLLKPRMEMAISALIQGIINLRDKTSPSHENELVALTQSLQRVSDKYITIYGQHAFTEFRRTLPALE